ncbi:hypothetical protein Tco_1546496 [Tanacetum coccineum]
MPNRRPRLPYGALFRDKLAVTRFQVKNHVNRPKGKCIFAKEECRNEMGRGLAQRTVIVRASYDLRVLSKAHCEGCRASCGGFHTGNHLEDGFTPLETIRRLLIVIGRRSYSGFKGEAFELKRRFEIREVSNLFYVCDLTVMSAKDTIVVQRYSLSAKELNEFLSFYPIPLEYDVMFSKSTQTIFDAPPDSIISSKYPQLLLDENKLNLKSFKDKLPPNIDENPYFQRLGRYHTSVRVFDDPILYLAGLKPSWKFGQQRPAIIRWLLGTLSILKMMMTLLFCLRIHPQDLPVEITVDSWESPKVDVFIVHLGSVAARIKERKCKTRGGSSRPPMKRKLAFGSSSSCVVQAKNSASKDDDPILSISNDDEGLPDYFELKDANACHLKISAITQPAWKGHLDNQIDLELIDLHDHCYARQAVARERSRKEECKAVMAEFNYNPAILALRDNISLLTADVKEHKEAEKARLEAVEVYLCREVEELKLVGTLVSSAITYGRCRAYDSVVVGLLHEVLQLPRQST